MNTFHVYGFECMCAVKINIHSKLVYHINTILIGVLVFLFVETDELIIKFLGNRCLAQ